MPTITAIIPIMAIPMNMGNTITTTMSMATITITTTMITATITIPTIMNMATITITTARGLRWPPTGR